MGLIQKPKLLLLDEPTAGVDVELRRDMWKLIGELRQTGVTIILTTHYIEEAEEMADRGGVINRGELMLVEEKTALMKKLGKKTLSVAPLPSGLSTEAPALRSASTQPMRPPLYLGCSLVVGARNVSPRSTTAAVVS